MTRIKICGLTNADDVRAACDLGADMLGFIFVPNTPRFVGADINEARRVMRAAAPLVWRVGVYDASPDASDIPPELHAIQYYQDAGDGVVGDEETAPLRIRSFRVKDAQSLAAAAAHTGPKAMIHLDAYASGALGGTGHTFNWDLATQAKRLGLPLMLAGGLTPDNVADAVAQARPYAVDVSSGVEAEPGRKDHDKLRRFIQAVRRVDADLGGGEGLRGR